MKSSLVFLVRKRHFVGLMKYTRSRAPLSFTISTLSTIELRNSKYFVINADYSGSNPVAYFNTNFYFLDFYR